MGKRVSYRFNSAVVKFDFTHDLWNELVNKNVSSDGKVNYKGFLMDKEKLIKYTSNLSNTPPSDNWTNNQQLAYWINAYNAFTVLLIVNHFPVKTIKEIGGNIPLINSVWDIKFFEIGGVKFDLNTIEHDILRKKFDEPRIHFAINCASKSCPKLRNEAFSEQNLEKQLENQAVDFINDNHYNELNISSIKLSKIFKWFEGDFTKGQTILEFISKYSLVKLNNSASIDYIEYDWNLNE